jgi:hypothetical protein
LRAWSRYVRAQETVTPATDVERAERVEADGVTVAAPAVEPLTGVNPQTGEQDDSSAQPAPVFPVVDTDEQESTRVLRAQPARRGNTGARAWEATGAGAAERAPAPQEVASAAPQPEPRVQFVEKPAQRHTDTAIRLPGIASTEANPPGRAESIQAFDEIARPSAHVDAVVTELSGVLFLVNVLDRLRFFDRLDDHFRVASTIGAWGWLEIVARCLLGSGHGGAAADPLWDALADLDGRPRGVPLTALARVPPRLRLPEAWPVSPRLPRVRVRPLGFEPTPDLRRFLDLVVPYLRWRLRQALDVHERRASPVASRLFYRRGRLEWTATHVDLRMDLSDIDIAIRLAGLDSNPGWVPALGRVVTFYFD